MSKNRQIQFKITQIREVEFFIDDEYAVGESFDFNYSVVINTHIETGLIDITVTVNYLNTDSKQIFFLGEVLTSFYVKEMKSYSRLMDNGQEQPDFTEQFLVTLFSIAFTHTRAILAKMSSGTKFENLLLPVINPQQEFQKLFGNPLATKS